MWDRGSSRLDSEEAEQDEQFSFVDFHSFVGHVLAGSNNLLCILQSSSFFNANQT